jgi:hypothetical protein
MIKPIPVNAARVYNPSWPGFYLLIVSNQDDTERAVYLTHEKMCTIHYLYGACNQSDGSMETMEETAETAYWNMENYLPEFVRDCCDNETE